MTFAIAFARRDFALLAADTRNTLVSDPLAPGVGFRDDAEKVIAWETGWMCSAPWMPWGAAIRAGVTRKYMGRLKAVRPECAQYVRDYQTTFVVGVNAAGPFRQCLDWRGREKFPTTPPENPVAPRPEGADHNTWLRLGLAYATAIADRPELEVLEATARLFRAMYETCGPAGAVSPLLTIGLVYADGHREYIGAELAPQLATCLSR